MINKQINKTSRKSCTTKFFFEISLTLSKLLSSNKKALLFLKKLEYSKNISRNKIKRKLDKYLLGKFSKNKSRKFKAEAKKSSHKIHMQKACKHKSSQTYKI